MNPFIMLSLLAGVMAVDHRAGWQGLLAQPVFAALLVGFVTGEVSVALPVGLILEFVWLSILPMRGSRQPDHIVGAITGAGTACILIQFTGDVRLLFVIAIGIFAGLVAGELSMHISDTMFRAHRAFLSRIEFGADADARRVVRKLSWLHAGSIAYIFVVQSLVAFVFLTICYAMSEWFARHAVAYFVGGAMRWNALMPALGAAAIIQLYWRPHLKRLLFATSTLMFLVLWLS